MKKYLLASLLLFFSSTQCVHALLTRFKDKYASTSPLSDTARTAWIQSFRQLRDLIYHADTTGVQSFFNFPVVTGGTELWYLLRGEAELNSQTAYNDKLFTGQDFKKYFGKLFPPALIKTMLKIKSDQLYKSDETVSPEIKMTGGEQVKLYVAYNKEEQTLSLNLASRFIPDEPGQDGSESNIIYIFRIEKNGQLRFVKLMMAG